MHILHPLEVNEKKAMWQYFCILHFSRQELFNRLSLEKVKSFTVCKAMRNWWNYNGMKENSIPLSGISTG